MLDLAKELHRFQSNAVVDQFGGGVPHDDLQAVLQQFSSIFHAEALDQLQVDTALVALIIANYVRRHDVLPEKLPALIAAVRHALLPSGEPVNRNDFVAERTTALAPAVPVEVSVTPDFIICLEDGRSCKSLKRYLRDHFSMTPEMYRARWGLPEDYPMVAPNFSRRRAEIARQNKLGRYSRA